MAAQITDVEREAFKKTFDMFDKNKDGHITSSELKAVLKELGHNPTDEEIDQFIKAVDIDDNKTIEFNEFCRYLVEMRRRIFNEIDNDGNGYITPDEVVFGFQKFGVTITIDDAKEIVKTADTDGDGRVSYDEFVKVLQNRPF